MKNTKQLFYIILSIILLPTPLLFLGLIRFDLTKFIEEYYKSISGLLQTLFTFYIFTLLYNNILTQKSIKEYNNKSVKLTFLKKNILEALSSNKSIKNNNKLSTNIYNLIFLIKEINNNYQKQINHKEVIITLINFDDNIQSNLIEIDNFIYSRKKAKTKDEIIDIVAIVIEFLNQTMANKEQ